jgi:hypothetical protein
MKLKRNQKTARFGWSLHIRREGETKFERVGENFVSRHLADQHRQRYYPTAAAARIMGIRANVKPLTATREGDK